MNKNLKGVAQIIENNISDANNSIRTGLDHGQAVMFKIKWIFAQVKKNWKSQTELIEALSNDNNFVVVSQFCQLKINVDQSPVLDKIARAIVEILFEWHEVETFSKVFKDLCSEHQGFLKSPEGLKGFVEFYPGLFITTSIGKLKIIHFFTYLLPSTLTDKL